MANQSSKFDKKNESNNTVKTKEKINAEIIEFHTNAASNATHNSKLEDALLDFTRSALSKSLDEFADDLPSEKKAWLKKLSKSLNEQISAPEDKTGSPDIKLNLLRIEVAREVSNIDQANGTVNAADSAQNSDENRGMKNAEKTKKRKKYNPLNLNQVLLRRKLV